MKRLFDIFFSASGLILLSPVLLSFIFLVWRQDLHSPFYIAPRMGLNKRVFKMVKLRSMVILADKSGVDSTSTSDARITPVGHKIRRYKLDEFMQLWNVFIGDMSLVGPRPNVEREINLYTSVEQDLLNVRPGITDFSSIVFSDEGDILKDSEDPDLDYNQLIRPWKSRLGLFYVKHANLILDIQLILITVQAIFSREKALQKVTHLLRKNSAPEDVIQIASRIAPLKPHPPPGSDHVVQSR